MSTSAAGVPRDPLLRPLAWLRRPAPAAPGWDEVPSGPVPHEVIRYFEEANAREEARMARRAAWAARNTEV